MKIELGKTYIDRDGRKVRIIATNVKHEKHTVAGIQTKTGGDEEIISYHTTGAFTKNPTGYDLLREATIYDDFKQGDLVLLGSPDAVAETLCIVAYIAINGAIVLQAFGDPISPRFAYVPEDGGSLKILMTAKEWQHVKESRESQHEN